ncbi:MAG TPA: SLC13 family permease, partial [Planctomycetota bacterium]|nr:SLC13 family permease [Planctomycetota bacterium]
RLSKRAMTLAGAYVLGLTVFALALFASDRLRVDVAALILLLLLTIPEPWIPGLLTAKEALSGFGSETIVVLIALFVLTEGVIRTGVVERLGLRMATLGGAQHPGAFSRGILLTAAGVSTFISNTLTTAIFLPLVIGASRRMKLPASKLLMPLAFATILTGTMTVIGTSTNLVVTGYLAREGLRPLGFFEMAPVGGVIAVLGMLYLLFLAPRLLPDRRTPESSGHPARQFAAEVVVQKDSSFVGKTLEQLRLAEVLDLIVIGVRRSTRRLLQLDAQDVLLEGDELVVQGRARDILSVKDVAGLDIKSEVKHEPRTAKEESSRMVEALVLPRSALVGRTLGGMRFSHVTGFTVLGMHTAGDEQAARKLSERRLRPSDVLLLKGNADDFDRLPRGLLVLDDLSAHHPRRMKGVWAAGIFIGSIVLGATGWLEMPVAFLLGVLILLLTRCIRAEEAYASVDWRLLVLIGVMLAFGAAMQKSGASAWLARLIVEHISPFGAYAVMAAFYLLTMILSQPMSNQAAALIVLPVAIETARGLGLDSRPLVIAVTLAASCSFLTPLEPACLLVYGPGRYRFRDFVRVGFPLTAIAFVTAMSMVPLFWSW